MAVGGGLRPGGADRTAQGAVHLGHQLRGQVNRLELDRRNVGWSHHALHRGSEELAERLEQGELRHSGEVPRRRRG